MLTLKKSVKVTEYNFRNDVIRWQLSKSADVILIFEKIGPVETKLTEKLTSLGSYRQTLTDLPDNCRPIIRIDRFPLLLRFEDCMR